MHFLFYLSIQFFVDFLLLDRRIDQARLVQPKNAPRHKQVMGQPLTDPPPPAALAAKWTVKASMQSIQ